MNDKLETSIRKMIHNRLPEVMRNSTDVLTAIDLLFRDNDDSIVDSEGSIGLFVDKFLLGITTIGIEDIGTRDYAYACKFVSYRLMGLTESMSYELVFPHKAMLVAGRFQDKEYDTHILRRARAFGRLAIVAKVTEVSSVTAHVTYAPVLDAAVNKLVFLMDNGSQKIQLDAATALLKELKTPESLIVKHEHTIELDTDSALDKFRKANSMLAATTAKMLENTDTTITDVDIVFKKEVSDNTYE